ncbi:MAG: Na/Pi cotransporter [Bacteroidetes bacterium RIFOXYA12_FULL_35_11]|nr:MAG: Na/Pi cotransporter [Bacteroidetes bacterium GWF2_35_48]OFY76472.1 MAG: Na/Pi cotransporter [Bacteroidetes bacterium RIFOXYA12_FULL_35_11]OFZ01965.1 MAG: Na/Pi cotransporter [Bacteroidetes bacterium RIFOXYC12_FULL_35_7]HBX51094.1 Na/Pi cotransporter [Bacteroidales bacterium]
MNYGILDFLTLIGSLALFLFGMKLMSEAMQKVAGNNLRKILSAMTSNRVFGVLTGLLITAIIQSSSATTVMVVSFVNAGLLSLTESIGVIMGANVGTTVTAWIISLVGFKVKISALALPLIGLGFPLIFSTKRNLKSWGEVVLGFALLFIGLDLLKNAIPDIKSNPEILTFLKSYTNYGFLSVLIFVGIGTLLTVVIQSSSATMALTLVMCHNGWISYEMAVGMILGENIGTTITANIAALIANVSSKRAALAHTLFNVFGVIWVLALIKPIVNIIAGITESMEGESPFTSTAAIPIALSLFHTSFNISNVLIQIWFVKYIEKAVRFIIKKKRREDESFGLKFLQTGMLSTSELSLLQAHKEVTEYGKKSQKMFNQVKKQFVETDIKKRKKIADKIAKNEEAMDEIEAEIANYLTKVSEGELSISGSRKIRTLLKISDNIESLADDAFNLSRALKRKNKQEIEFTPEQIQEIQHMFELIDKAFAITMEALHNEKTDMREILAVETKINETRTSLKKKNEANLNENKYTYKSSVIYIDMITICETLGDHLINVNEALYSQNSELSIAAEHR